MNETSMDPACAPARAATRATAMPPTAVAAVEIPCDAPCDAPCPRAAAMPRRVCDVCPDAGSRLALAVARYVAGARATGETDCIEAAFAEAEAALPAESAALLVGALGGLVRALEAHAGRPLAVLPASCCRATADEAALLEHVARARSDGAGAAEGRVARTAATVAALLGPVGRTAGRAS
ncbi:hypothetical protein [Salinarimonas chemoclinalis]|uniref:hypothetical protein n=1 Tax=Salinarimonas chemoclinalis TaxID=3241599 RepID=UPI0035581D27